MPAPCEEAGEEVHGLLEPHFWRSSPCPAPSVALRCLVSLSPLGEWWGWGGEARGPGRSAASSWAAAPAFSPGSQGRPGGRGSPSGCRGRSRAAPGRASLTGEVGWVLSLCPRMGWPLILYNKRSSPAHLVLPACPPPWGVLDPQLPAPRMEQVSLPLHPGPEDRGGSFLSGPVSKGGTKTKGGQARPALLRPLGGPQPEQLSCGWSWGAAEPRASPGDTELCVQEDRAPGARASGLRWEEPGEGWQGARGSLPVSTLRASNRWEFFTRKTDSSPAGPVPRVLGTGQITHPAEDWKPSADLVQASLESSAK